MNFSKDRFDDIPPSLDRRGAHRAPRTRGAKLMSWIWGLAAIAVLVTIGLIGMTIIDGVVSFDNNAASPTPTATETETAPATTEAVQPKLDPNIPVTVLNGTSRSGIASRFGTKLGDAGWNVVNRDDADNENYTSTSVLYGAAADEAAALAVVQSLGGGTATLDPVQARPGSITVIIGADLAR